MENIVIFGVSGDLSRRYLLPALDNLAASGNHFNYFGFSRHLVDKSTLNFSQHLELMTGEYNYQGLKSLAPFLTPDTIFYFSLPTNYELIVSLVSGLLRHHLVGESTRLVIEKPFGTDSKSAQKLMDYLSTSVGQDKVFLVDHYLSKELVRNIISLRFANPIIHQLWHKKHIAEINIIAVESEGIGSRSRYYDQIGAIRDMVQNHCLQLLAISTMAEPARFDHSAFSIEKLKIINHLALSQKVKKNISIGQYQGYLRESGVAPHSLTETFAQIKFEINLPQWQGVPITITTGKKMDQKLTEINIIFKKSPSLRLWKDSPSLNPNVLSINLSPQSDISLSLNTSFQPHDQLPQPQNLHLGSLSLSPSSAYENVIIDILHGVKINSPSFAQILAQWKLVDKIISLPRLQDKLFYY